MPSIRVQCQNCGKEFSAWDDLIGKAVKCPKCQAQMVIPAKQKVAGPPKKAVASRTSSASKSPSKPRRAPGPRQRSSDSAQSRTKSLHVDGPGAAPRTEHPVASRSSPVPVSAAGIDEFDESDALPIVCPNCRAPLARNEDLCDACGYHKILEKVIDLEGVVRRDQSTGFERAVKKHLHESDTVGTLFWFKVAAGFTCLAVLIACLGGWFWVGALVVAGGYALYCFKGRDGQDGGINDDPVLTTMWSALLTLQRATGWRRREWPFPRARTLIIRDSEFDDEAVSELENLQDLQVLDFEGTQVSNKGLTYLTNAEGFRAIQCIVLRHTQVTQEGVRRLQQAVPDAWIWS